MRYTKNDDHLCVICRRSIAGVARAKDNEWLQGHNAEPIMSGQCCDTCNVRVVVPFRIKLTRQRIADMQDHA